MGVAQQVIQAAEDRAAALAAADSAGLEALLHEDFRWTTHIGETYGRHEYISRNTEGHTVRRSQALIDPDVVVVGDTAVLCAKVVDLVIRDGGDPDNS